MADIPMDKIERVDEFVSLYMENSLRLRAFVRTLVPIQADAEDVFQETSRTLWAKFDQYQSGTNFLAWADSIAHFKVLEYRRLKARLPLNMNDQVFDLIAAELLQAPAEDDRQYLRALTECLQLLPPRDRELIDSRYRSGQTTKAAAAALSRSVDAIYRSLRRIHRVLFECIQRRIAKEGGVR
jgi:RNA polymerase sigma-70 factor (ECF subfamily)